MIYQTDYNLQMKLEDLGLRVLDPLTLELLMTVVHHYVHVELINTDKLMDLVTI